MLQVFNEGIAEIKHLQKRLKIETMSKDMIFWESKLEHG